ncbi:hypothetical protein GCM10027449_22210 [Sinomonas notoginsengisoli]|uniref:hypothetical protein n=1 Tax=Sinomonas notoginsengisoli TaxID=1457311 RepID=UPI001F3F4A1D|nr:hypothetical protein [Sinomonas notoginsengisoli]
MTKITAVELAAETVELLPGRDTLLFDANLAGIWASNSSLALNVGTVFSQANSAAVQTIVVSQH